MELGEEECHRIASGVPDGVTAMQLRGILLQWMQQQHREPQDRDQILQAMLLQQHRSHTPSLDLIAKAAARALGVRLSEMRGNTKRSQIVRARGLAILMARRWTELSLQQIGDYFGGRDHTTILHAVRKTEADLQGDVELQRAAEEMRQRVRG
jgi:chromosomal replication initiator protein